MRLWKCGLRLAAALVACVLIVSLPRSSLAQEPLRVRRNIFGCHNLKDGGPAFDIGIDWTAEMNGSGFVFDWVRGDYEVWMAYCFQRGLIPCMRLQNGNGGELPSAGYMGQVTSTLCQWKLAHPEYADRLVYLQLWNEPGDRRDWVEPEDFADFMVAGYAAVKNAEAAAAAQNPSIAGTFMVMAPGQNGPAWWQDAFAHNPQAKNAFDVWATHPYPETNPPWFNHHDGVCSPNAVKTIDSYVLDLDKIAENHGGVSRRGFPVMITETCYGDHLGSPNEGYPKTTRELAATYCADEFTERWYKWPEIIAAHHYILCNITWNAFGLVNWQSGSVDTDGDGVREPTAPYPQYNAIMNARKSLEAQGKLAPARLTPYRGPKGSISGAVTRLGAGTAVKYATIYTDGYEFGNVSLFDGGYAIKDVPVGTYALTCHKNGYADSSTQVTVTANQNTTASFSLAYTGKDPTQFYFIDTAQGTCSGCSLYAPFLGQTFTTPSDVGFIKFCSAKPNVGSLYLKFTLIDGNSPNGTIVGTWNSYYLETGGEMIGGEAPGDGIAVLPNHTYFLKIERLDGQSVYLYASDQNPYSGGNAWVGNTSLPNVDLYGCYRGNRLSMGDATAPGAPAVTDDGAYTTSTTQLHATWSASDPESGIAEYRYAIGTTQGGTDVAGWTSAGTNTAVTRTVSLAQGQAYYFSVEAKNGAGMWSPRGYSNGIRVSQSAGSLGALRAMADGAVVSLPAKVISCKASSAFWAQETNRTCAIRVNAATTASEGSLVTFSGVLATEGGERVLNSPEVGNPSPGTPPKPLGVSGSALGGATCGTYTPGAAGSLGPNNVGLLVKCWGRVTSAASDHFYLDDGSEAPIKVLSGSLTEPTVDHYVYVTGISGLEPAGGSSYRAVLRVLKQSEIHDPSAPSTGAITGRVTSGGAGLAAATVSTSTGGYTATTNSSGDYTLANVSPGTYDVTASKSGYVPRTNSGVSVAAGQTVTSNFALQVQQPFSGITNGSFEGGWFNDPDGDRQSGNSWHRFSLAGSSKSGGDYGQYHSSHWSQTIYESSWTAGIYQQATNAIPGASYTASVWVKGADSGVKFWVGIDPYGGTNASSANIQWSAQSAPGATWTRIAKTAAAQASTITIFIKAQNTVASNRNAWIDDVTLTAD